MRVRDGSERFYPVRGLMFIDREAKPLRLRSKERNGSGAVKLYLNSAPSDGVGSWVARESINIPLLAE